MGDFAEGDTSGDDLWSLAAHVHITKLLLLRGQCERKQGSHVFAHNL